MEPQLTAGVSFDQALSAILPSEASAAYPAEFMLSRSADTPELEHWLGALNAVDLGSALAGGRRAGERWGMTRGTLAWRSLPNGDRDATALRFSLEHALTHELHQL